MEFRTCPNWPCYEISEYGDIRRVIKGKRQGFIGARKPYITSTGYLYIVMRNEKFKMACSIHRLVAEAFIGMPDNDEVHVAHGDGNKMNNHFSNLRYATRSENEMDKVLHGRSNRGENFGRSRLTEDQVIEIKSSLSVGVKSKSLAQKFGVAWSTVRSIQQGKSWFWL